MEVIFSGFFFPIINAFDVGRKGGIQSRQKKTAREKTPTVVIHRDGGVMEARLLCSIITLQLSNENAEWMDSSGDWATDRGSFIGLSWLMSTLTFSRTDLSIQLHCPMVQSAPA